MKNICSGGCPADLYFAVSEQPLNLARRRQFADHLQTDIDFSDIITGGKSGCANNPDMI